MENDFKNIDDLFRDGLGDYVEAPPPPVWQALEQRLDNDRKRRVFPFRWYWFIGLLSFIVLLGASVAWKVTKEDGAPSPVAAAMPAPITEPVKAPEATPAATTTATFAHRKKAGHRIAAKHVHHHITTKTHIAPTNNETENTTAAASDEYVTSRLAGNSNYSASNSSVYAYEEDEATPVTMSEPAARSEAKPATTGYVVNRKQQHRMVAAEMTPVATEPNSYAARATSNDIEEDDNDVVVSTPLPEIAQPTQHKHTSANRNHTAGHKTGSVAVAADKKQRLSKQVQTTPAVTVAKRDRKLAAPKVEMKNLKVAASCAVVSKQVKPKLIAEVKREVVKVTANNVERVARKIAAQHEQAVQKADQERVVKAEQVAAKPIQQKTKAVVSSHADVAKSVAGEERVVTKKKVVAGAETRMNTKTAATVVKEKRMAASNTTKEQIVKTNGTKIVEVKKHEVIADVVVRVPATEKKAVVAKIKPVKVLAAVPGNGNKVYANTTPVSTRKAIKAVANNGQPEKIAKVVAGKTNKPAQSARVVAAKTSVAVMNKPAPAAMIPNAAQPAARLRPVLNNDGEIAEPYILNAAPQAAPKAEEAVAKKETTDSAVAAKEAKDEAAKDAIRKFVYGIKGGYEGALGPNGGNKAVLAPYLEYRLNDRFSLMTQPAIKAANAPGHSIGPVTSYHDTVKGTTTYTFKDSQTVHLIGAPDAIKRNYLYRQTYDSVVKSYSVGGTYWEAEVPLMLKYKLDKKLSVYGGINVGYSKFVPVKENTTTMQATYQTTVSTLSGLTQAAPAPSTAQSQATLPGVAMATYGGPMYPSHDGGTVKLGYMLGVSYELKKRWMIDVLVQQAKVKPLDQGGFNVNNALSLPYFRFMLGYRLSK